VLDGLVGYESYGSKVPGIEGLVDQPTSIRPYDAVTEAAPLSPPSQSPKQKHPQNHPSNLLQAVIC